MSPGDPERIAAVLRGTELERRAAKSREVVAIGVGLYADYGAAQRLYVKRGYIPDGTGVWAGDVSPEAGALFRVDDDLVLYLIKRLVNAEGA